MPQYDAASIVGQMAGLDPSTGTPVTPEQLAASFCRPAVAQGLIADPGTRTTPEGTVVSRGFCGYNGQRSDDFLVSGFDDGYDFMGNLESTGWRALAAKGDWPYIVYMRWPATTDTKEAIAEYCEGDLTVWQFENHQQAKTFYATLRDCP
jgi:hypothetical protein